MTIPCEFRWYGSRVEAETLPVHHVCNEERLHEGDHVCSCGAKTDEHTIGWPNPGSSFPEQRFLTDSGPIDVGVDLSTVQWKGRMVPFALFIMIQDKEKAMEMVQVTLDQFPPMNDADVEMVQLGEYWIARVTVWWA